MRKIAITCVLFAGLFASRPAEACRGNARCPLIVGVFAYGLAAAVVGGYAYGTGYFAYHDLTDETQTMKYGVGELAYNGTFGAMFTYGAIEAARDGDVGTAVIAGTLGLGHNVLAVHGAWRIKTEWKDPGHAPDNTRTWIAGIAYSANTLAWTAGLPGEHGRTYGVVEAAVNAPIAAGLGYLAIERGRDGERGAALLYGGMAAISGALTYHGLRTAISPHQSRALDLLGTDVMPTAVSDGREVAPGIAMSGTW
ncbi:MAG: hypothetical protein M4D80_34590 [Myxococcota bacterium]|nr:hypothetical protein [Myxococcota bacterium]